MCLILLKPLAMRKKLMTFTSIKVIVQRHGYVTFTSRLERRVNTVNDFLKKNIAI